MLTAISGVTAAGTINAAIVATWTFSDDQDVDYFNVQLKRTSDTTWTTTNKGAETTFMGLYDLLQPILSLARLRFSG